MYAWWVRPADHNGRDRRLIEEKGNVFRRREEGRFFGMAVGVVCSSLECRSSMAVLVLEWTLHRGETRPCSGQSRRAMARGSWCPSFAFRSPG
jgi:hypothetical protein